ncbi:MAG: hypothetical protein ACLVJN_02940 [Streptococcus parasanguinis]
MKTNHDNTILIQHSAGSGKTNTIAWLAHSLCLFMMIKIEISLIQF